MADAMPDSAGSLLKSVHPTAAIIGCEPLAGGRNNRAYRLETSIGSLLLKQYFRGGDWDRLAAESLFLVFCREGGVDRVPGLIAHNPATKLALHEWLDGVGLEPGQPDANDVAEAAAFLGAVAAASRTAGIAGMPAARDACLCPGDFSRSPGQRLAELGEALANGPAMPCLDEAAAFFRERLLPAWERIRNLVPPEWEPERPFPPDRLIVSPSDFGFHNALRLSGGGLGFVDFEYAGLDSPAKAIADFICQPSVPPPDRAQEPLAAAVYPDSARRKELSRLIEAVLPLVRIKFCCIILNDFKGLDAQRRGFAMGGDAEQRLRNQLGKAVSYFERHVEA